MNEEFTKVNTSLAFQEIARGISEYVKKYNLKSMILGLSGGIDSTVCAALCWIAKQKLKSEGYDVQIIGVSLPCSSNGDDENDIAARCSCFCDKFRVQNLEYDYYRFRESCEVGIEVLENKDDVSLTPIAQGNIKARLRMIYLYNLASMYNGIVIDTDNLTEHFLGFWTIHGDDGDLNPIGSLWKTEVYDMAKSLIGYLIGYFAASSIEAKEFNKEDTKLDAYRKMSDYDCMVKCLEDACAITPTDGNGVAVGGDLAQIAPGKTYADVDYILQSVIPSYEAGLIPSENVLECLYSKYGKETVERVISRYKGSKYKRAHRPLVITILGNVEGKDKSFDLSIRTKKNNG
jgi:NAD+ synthetase